MSAVNDVEALADEIEHWVAEWEYRMATTRGMPSNPGPLADYLAARLSAHIAAVRVAALEEAAQIAEKYGQDNRIIWINRREGSWRMPEGADFAAAIRVEGQP